MKNKKCFKTITAFHLESRNVKGKKRLSVKWEDDIKEKTPLDKAVGNNETRGQA